MRTPISVLLTTLFFAFGLLASSTPSVFQAAPPEVSPTGAYLGFDRNQYPGDATLGSLRRTFSFSGYWLNVPPGEVSNSWPGKREVLISNGFGFLVLFNGRLERQLKTVSNAKVLGSSDAALASEAAKKEGFALGTVIFLDQEEGGRMLPEQQAYVYAWVDGVAASGYQAGVYCSGIAARESRGVTITSANDLRDNAGDRKIVFFVYNDSCPPSSGCAFPKNPPAPRNSGIPFAAIWQFAQSPRRRNLTASCPSLYNADGNCYAPLLPKADGAYLDIDSADSADPSSGRTPERR